MQRTLFFLAFVLLCEGSVTARAQVGQPFPSPPAPARPDQTGRIAPAGRFANPERVLQRGAPLPATSRIPLPAGVGPNLYDYLRSPTNTNTYVIPMR